MQFHLPYTLLLYIPLNHLSLTIYKLIGIIAYANSTIFLSIYGTPTDEIIVLAFMEEEIQKARTGTTAEAHFPSNLNQFLTEALETKEESTFCKF